MINEAVDTRDLHDLDQSESDSFDSEFQEMPTANHSDIAEDENSQLDIQEID